MKLTYGFVAIVYAGLCICSCAWSGSKPGLSASSSVTPGKGADSVYAGKNSLSYSVEGRHVAIKDNLVLGEHNYAMALFLNNVKNKVCDGTLELELTNILTHEVFNFKILNAGCTTITHYSPGQSASFHNKDVQATYMSRAYLNYYGDSVTINIRSIDQTRVSGTFSGKFLSEEGSNKELNIAGGSFDVSFTKPDEK